MINWLRRLMGSAEAFRPSYGMDDGSDTEGASELSRGTTDALRKFVLHVCAHVGKEEARRLACEVVAMTVGSDPAEALIEGLAGDGGQRPGGWVLIQADWKAVEEIEWQALEMTTALGMEERWVAPQGDNCIGEAQTMLDRLGSWLAERQHVLLHLDGGDDACYAFVLPESRAEQVLAAASEAGLSVRRAEAL